MNQAGKPVALVTGSSGGIGMLTCLALAEKGHQVVAAMRNLAKGEQLRTAAAQAGTAGRIECVEMDVTDGESVRQAVEEAAKRHGHIDVLVNNAGYAQGGFAEEVPLIEWKRQFETNLFGVIAVTQAVLPHMRKKRGGTIINVSSVSGRIGFPAMGPYVASKFALEGFSESLRLELLPFGIRVVLVEPGAYRTGIWDKGMESVEFRSESPYAAMTEAILRGVRKTVASAGDPAEVAQIIAAIATHPSPTLRYPVGSGVKTGIFLKHLLPWKWLERLVVKNLFR